MVQYTIIPTMIIIFFNILCTGTLIICFNLALVRTDVYVLVLVGANTTNTTNLRNTMLMIGGTTSLIPQSFRH